MKQPKDQGQRWDDRVGIAIMIITWLTMGALGLWWLGGQAVASVLLM